MFTLIWVIQLWAGLLGPKDHERLRHGLGLWGPEMQPHWERLWVLRDGHSLVNVGTEWVRLDPQRAFKVGVDTVLALGLTTVWGML